MGRSCLRPIARMGTAYHDDEPDENPYGRKSFQFVSPRFSIDVKIVIYYLPSRRYTAPRSRRHELERFVTVKKTGERQTLPPDIVCIIVYHAYVLMAPSLGRTFHQIFPKGIKLTQLHNVTGHFDNKQSGPFIRLPKEKWQTDTVSKTA